MKVVGIIPARYASTRLPGKPLADIQGRPLIEHVWRRVCRARYLERVIVATDDERIAEAVERFGGEAVMTPAACASGTDRLALVAKKLACEVVVNIQGDEPFIQPAAIDRLCAPFARNRSLQMATLAAPLPAGAFSDPHAVKVVCDLEGYALYFSRAPIPYPRDGERLGFKKNLRLHVGLYAYRRDFLLRFAAWPRAPLEKIEKLEQLRALEHGVKIRVIPVSQATVSVDTPEDLERVRGLCRRRR